MQSTENQDYGTIELGKIADEVECQGYQWSGPTAINLFNAAEAIRNSSRRTLSPKSDVRTILSNLVSAEAISVDTFARLQRML